MIIANINAGLGNQLFTYAVARKFSIVRHNPIILDFSGYKKMKFRPNRLIFFNVKINILSFLYNKFHFYNHFIERILITDEPWWKFKENLYLNNSNNIEIKGVFASVKYFNEIRDLLIVELALKKKYLNKIKSEVERIRSINSVSIHIRRGDYVLSKDSGFIFELLPITYYINAIEFIVNKTPNPVFFIFSDDITWTKENLHTNYEHYYINDLGIDTDYLEFELMKNCKHNIIANSTFSWWAAWLNVNNGKIVIQPKLWFKLEEAQKEYENHNLLTIEDWIRL